MAEKMTFYETDLRVIYNALEAAASKFRGYADELALPRIADQFKRQAAECDRVRADIVTKTGIC